MAVDRDVVAAYLRVFDAWLADPERDEPGRLSVELLELAGEELREALKEQRRRRRRPGAASR